MAFHSDDLQGKNKIRQSLNEISNRSAEFAKELLQRRFKNRKIEIEEAILTKVIKRLGYKTATDFYNEISSEKLDIGLIVDSYVALKEKKTRPNRLHPVAPRKNLLCNRLHCQAPNPATW